MQNNANCTWCAMSGRDALSGRPGESVGHAESGHALVESRKKLVDSSRHTMVKKLLLTMKLTAFLVMVTFFQVAAKTSAQTITLTGQHLDLKRILSVVEQQTGYAIFYKKEVLAKARPVDVDAHNQPVAAFLESALKDQPIGYQLMDKTIVLKLKEENVMAVMEDQNKPSEHTGRITDKKGNPLPGVTVQVKGTTKGTATNGEGRFTIAANSADVLVFTFIGYKTREISLKDNPTLNLSMEENVSGLGEVVVTGYQNISKKLYTGAAATISGADVKQDGVVDVSRMLEGKVAGVSVQNVSGTFGAAPKIRVRGATSISGDNKPLWVVDNVVLEDIVNISNDQLSSGDPLTLIGSSVAGINADDIESINILKDASATAMYGARAMNGVVVITTKKGKAGNTAVNYSGNFSTLLKPSYNNYDIMNSADQMSVYAEMYRKGSLSSGITNGANGGVYYKMYNQIKTYDQTTGKFGLENTPEARAAFLSNYAKANTDWFGILFRNSFIQEHSIGITSGTDKSQHYVSLGYYNDAGWTIADRATRYTLNLRGNYNVTNRLSAAVLATAVLRQQRAPGTQNRSSNVVEGTYIRDFDINPFSYALNTSRTMTAYDKDGNLEYFTRNYAPFNIINELENNYINLDMMDTKIQGELGYKFSNDLNFKTIGAIRYVKTSRENIITENSNMAGAYRYAPNSTVANNNLFLYDDPDHPEIIDKEIVLPQGGFYNTNDDKLLNYYLRNQLEWKHSINNDKHLINAFVGQEIKYTDRQNKWNNGYGYQYDKGGVPYTDYRILKMMLEGNYNYFGMSKNFDRYASFFANASYAYDGKYVINGTVRYDGSNKMGESKTARWLPTWTVSGAWNLDQEAFIKDIRQISYMKLRASYGLTASMGNANNSSVILANANTVRPRLSEMEPAIEISSLENAELTWEKQYEKDLGIDLGLFKNKLNISADYYKRDGFDLIGLFRTSGIGGQSSKYANYANMTSNGLEVTIGGLPVKTKDFNWNTSLTFGYNKNKVTNLKSKPRIYDLVIPEGGASEGHAVRGLYSIDFQRLNPTGMPLYINESGQLSNNVYMQSTTRDYLKYEGPVDPTITGGWNNTFNWKNLSLNIFVSYQAGNKIRLYNAFRTSYDDTYSMPKAFLDRWTLPLDENVKGAAPSIADYLTKAGLGSAYPYTAYNYTSDRVADGGFVRVKQLSLSYAFPKVIANAVKANNLALKFQANNLFLIYSDKKLKGQDPEFFSSGGVAMPVPKQFTFTVKAGF